MSKLKGPKTEQHLEDAFAALHSTDEDETREYTNMYPEMARMARDGGFEEIAEWFENLSKAKHSDAKETPNTSDTSC